MTDLNLMATNIKNTLSTVPNLKETFDFEPQSMNQLPAATLFFDGFTQSEETTRQKSVDWRWTVRIYVPIRVSDIKVPQIELRNLINDTIKQFRSDINLSGACLYHTINSADVFAMLEQTNPMLIAEMNLVATTRENF